MTHSCLYARRYDGKILAQPLPHQRSLGATLEHSSREEQGHDAYR
jgi:hypothetical protein